MMRRLENIKILDGMLLFERKYKYDEQGRVKYERNIRK